MSENCLSTIKLVDPALCHHRHSHKQRRQVMPSSFYKPLFRHSQDVRKECDNGAVVQSMSCEQFASFNPLAWTLKKKRQQGPRINTPGFHRWTEVHTQSEEKQKRWNIKGSVLPAQPALVGWRLPCRAEAELVSGLGVSLRMADGSFGGDGWINRGLGVNGTGDT